MIRDITPADYGVILRLNSEFVHWLSPLDEAALIILLSHCAYAKILKDQSGFLLGYDGNSSYRHKNVDYLSPRLPTYGYIDRVVIDAPAQGRGLARIFYDDFADWSRQNGFAALGCEVNTKPDNPASHAFHLRYGFHPIGDVHYPEFDKALRYYRKDLQRG